MILPQPRIDGSFKVLVSGGRDFFDAKLFNRVMLAIHDTQPITFIVHGGATGADSLADLWADVFGITKQKHEANWTKYGKAAGMIRNGEMLDKHPDIDLVVAFPGHSGTRGMVRLARDAHVPTIHVIDNETYKDTDGTGKDLNDIPDNL